MENIQLKFYNLSMDVDNYFALLLHSGYVTHYVSNIFSWLQIDIIINHSTITLQNPLSRRNLYQWTYLFHSIIA